MYAMNQCLKIYTCNTSTATKNNRTSSIQFRNISSEKFPEIHSKTNKTVKTQSNANREKGKFT